MKTTIQGVLMVPIRHVLSSIRHVISHLAAAAAFVFAGAVAAQSQIAVDFDLPAQPLENSLRHVADTQKLQMIYVRSDLNGVRASAVKGRYTPAQAVAKLTEGTGLVASFSGNDMVVIKPKDEKRPSAPGGASNASPTLLAQAQGQQATSSGQSADSEKPVQLEGITVTAQKRSELLIDVPQSVTVLTANDLAKLGAVQFRDFANTVPGLNFATNGTGFTQPSMRGVTTGFDLSPTVAIYVDEVPYGGSTNRTGLALVALDAALFDLNRIEVLRGPQGTLYGASSMGGLIKYVNNQPNTTRFAQEGRIGVATTAQGGVSYHVAAMANMPIVTDQVALRANVFESHDGGFIDNIMLGQKNVNRADVYGGRLKLLLKPIAALSIQLDGVFQNISNDGWATVDYRLEGVPRFGDLDQSRTFAEPFSQHFRLFSATATYDFGPATLTSISSYQTTRTQLNFDQTDSLVPVLRTLGPPYNAITGVLAVDNRSWNRLVQELRLASATTGSLEWLIGGFYTREKGGHGPPQVFDTRDQTGQPGADVFTASIPARFQEEAVFGDVTWHFSRRFDVTGGMRYSRHSLEFTQTASGLFGRSFPTVSSSESVSTYLANARYHFGDHATGYLRYATGYRPGGPNVPSFQQGVLVFRPPFEADTLKSYEVGFKAETPDRNFSVDLSTYHIDWSNIQVSFSGILNAPGGATSRGAELTLTARPTRGFTATAALGYQDAYLNANEPSLGARKGERMPGTPRITAALNADYAFPLASLRPTVGTTVRYVSDRWSAFGTAATNYHLPAYTAVDVRSGLTFGSIDVLLYVRNLFDRRGQLSALYTGFGPTARVGVLQPRTIGINLTTHF